jgi:hypothetical protein
MATYNNDENQRMDREWHNRDSDHYTNKKYSYRDPKDQKWDEGNYFHTGPAKRGAQDRYKQQPENRSYYPRESHARLNEHYGSRPNSAYRNERSFLDHGDSFSTRNYNPQQGGGGSQPGNFNEPPTSRYELYNDVPGGRSRYKESDYRYGSGSHNWYREGRYTPDHEEASARDNRGFFDRVRDTWNDIMHSDDPDYQPRRDYPTNEERISSRKRYGSEPYRDRNFDRGYEGGPRWADEVDSGEDNYYNDTDRSQHKRW